MDAIVKHSNIIVEYKLKKKNLWKILKKKRKKKMNDDTNTFFFTDFESLD